MKRILILLLGLPVLLGACAPVTVPAESDLLPELGLPADAQLFGGGGGGGPGVEGHSFEFASDLSLEAIHAFYAAQLSAAGWREVDHPDTDGQQLTFWELVDTSGSSWAARLTVMTVPSGNGYLVDVHLLQPR